jgi:hypothetical protein
MNHPPDNKHLLDDVLSEAEPADFREALLCETLRLARRRRRWRNGRHAAVVLTLMALVAVLVWQNDSNHPAGPTLTAKEASKSYQLILTQPLPTDSIVTTRPLARDQFIASAATVVVVQTIPGGGFRLINDDELLALLSPRPAALIRLGPNSERLILVNADDENGLPMN